MSNIQKFIYSGLWNIKDVVWNNINPDVNVLVGINGAGKTTILQLIEKRLKSEGTNYLYIPSVDNIALHDRWSNATALSQDLDHYVYDLKHGPSFMMKLVTTIGQPAEIQSNINIQIQQFLRIINDYLSLSEKALILYQSKLVVEPTNGQILSLDVLSSGEKYLLLLLLRVFLLDEQPAVILIDEPEITLHIRWQRELIDTLVQLNPKAQYVITTHSPSLFSKGWGDKVIYMEEIIKPR